MDTVTEEYLKEEEGQVNAPQPESLMLLKKAEEPSEMNHQSTNSVVNITFNKAQATLNLPDTTDLDALTPEQATTQLVLPSKVVIWFDFFTRY